jgi:hypothetical protein
MLKAADYLAELVLNQVVIKILVGIMFTKIAGGIP